MKSRDLTVRDGAVPDEVLELPFGKMERFGRLTRITTKRTPEQQQELLQRMREYRPVALERMKEIRNALRSLIHEYGSLELLAVLIMQNILHDPDTYREFDSELRPHFCEYVALLELEDAEFRLREVKPMGNEPTEAQSLLEELFSTAMFYYGSEHALAPTAPGAPSKLEELRFTSVMHNMAVRSPAYHDHWVEILKGLFNLSAVKHWLAARHIQIVSFIKLVDAVQELMQQGYITRIGIAKSQSDEILREVKSAKQGATTIDPEKADLITRLGKLSGKERKLAISSWLTQWIVFCLPHVWTFTAEEIADLAGVPIDDAKAFLHLLSISFGQPSETDPIPKATHALQQRPIISYVDKYFPAAAHLMLWAIKPSLEEYLKVVPGAPWHSYERARANYLVEKGLELLKRVLPDSGAWTELYYEYGKRCELDGLLVFDNFAFLIEGKAGAASAAGKRGATISIATDIKKLIEDPALQASRAKAYIESSDTPIFRRKDGTVVTLDKSKIKNFVLLSLTLDDVGLFASDMAALQKAGLLKNSELPWTIYLPDLCIITEILESPSEFLHYAAWRRELYEEAGLASGTDEVNWLGIYLAEGPAKLQVPAQSFHLSFTTYTTSIDDYFLYKMGSRSKPARRPSSKIPVEVRELITSVERARTFGFTELTSLLLGLRREELFRLAKKLRKLKSCRSSVTDQLSAGDVDVVLAIGTNAIPATTPNSKTILRLEFDPTSRELRSWCISRNQPVSKAIGVS